ncbi:MAG: N-acetyl-D-Glu racemase DgcA [Hyphomicrobium sp.]|jgi:L-alanine-DL-glutamate epimerase-like enolase superfamily enzyme
MSFLTLTTAIEAWPLKVPFVIARGAKTEAKVVAVSVSDGMFLGRGECVPYARYGETVESVVCAIEEAIGKSCIAGRDALQDVLAPGAARNALDCALWDLEAKRNRTSAAALAGIDALRPLETCYTLSLASPGEMAAAAAAVPQMKLLKLKLGGEGDQDRMQAVRRARPDARLVGDANEAWTPSMLLPLLTAASEAGIELIEQPLHADDDAALMRIPHLVPICADESAHSSSDILRLASRYDAVNIKLDKAGGLTEALDMAAEARRAGMRIMVGSMVATSLSIAPAFLVGQDADWVDLDGPLLLARDREPGFTIENGFIGPPPGALWG